MKNNREVLKIVVVGHVDHGKSTVVGRLLYDTKSIPEGAIERVKRISKEKGKPFEYAYLLDAFEEEQKQGITIDTTQLQFHTEKRDYVIIDAPGHKEFLKNMISGAASAEAALLVIDAQEGIQEQSKRHGYILSLLGIQKVYVVVNKMDLIDYSEEKFKKIEKEFNEFLNSLNVYPLKYIPISAFLGENLTTSSEKMPWYKDEPILKAIDLIEKEKGLEEKPLRFPIQDVYKFDNRRIIAGRIESGKLSVGDKILISPSNKATTVKSIEYWADRDKRNSVYAGISVGITVEDEFFNKRGELITHKSDAPIVTDTFRVNLFWMGKNALVKDKKYKIKLATQEVECEILKINRVIDATNLETLENASEVKINDVGEVTIKTKEKVCFDEFRDNQSTGRFVIVDGYDVCGGGIVSGVEKVKQLETRFFKNGRELAVQCFDEYYYLVPDNNIKRIAKTPVTYRVGDEVPVKGKTYEYPVNFNIIDLHNKLVAQIREAKLQDLIEIDSFLYDGSTLINAKGFHININSQVNFDAYSRDFEEFSLFEHERVVAFANEWNEINKYKTIKYIESSKVNGLDYEI